MDALQHTKDLVAFETTSALSNVLITDHVEETLKQLGFVTERLEYDDARGVRKANVVGKKGKGTGGVAYFGHTDVVPAASWFTDEHGPFTPTVKGDKLFGRGSCDMKGSVACMLAAAERFSASDLKKPIYITCTADEEVGYGGATQVAQSSELFKEMVAGDSNGIIGEPTTLEVVYAHKATCGFTATSRGRAAHSSTNEGINANLKMIPFLVELKKIQEETESDPAWLNNEFDPPTTTWNICISDHTKTFNVVPAKSVCTVYFRVMPGQDANVLLDRVRREAEKHGLEFEVVMGSDPVYVDPKSEVIQTVLKLAEKKTPRTVSYGTDGAMFTALKNMVVFGPGDIAQAHTHDEWIELEQLELGTEMYTRLVKNWCC